MKAPALPDYPQPHLPVIDLQNQLVLVLDQLQRHAAHAGEDVEMRRLVMAATHVAMASTLLRPGVAGAGPHINTQQALIGLQTLVRGGGIHEH